MILYQITFERSIYLIEYLRAVSTVSYKAGCWGTRNPWTRYSLWLQLDNFGLSDSRRMHQDKKESGSFLIQMGLTVLPGMQEKKKSHFSYKPILGENYSTHLDKKMLLIDSSYKPYWQVTGTKIKKHCPYFSNGFLFQS